jgi:hypothetical protein
MASELPMTSLESALRELCDHLAESKHAFALIGGLAVSVRTEPRFTRDADIAVAVSDDTEAEALVRALQGGGYVVSSTVEQQAAARLAAVRLAPPDGSSGPVLDLLFASSGIEREVVASAGSFRCWTL